MRGAGRIGVVVALAGVVLGASAADMQKQGAGTIAGRVVDAGSGEAIADATVSYSTDRNRTRASVQSDTSGRFVLTDVPPGRLSIRSVKTGYVGGTYGQVLPFSPGQNFDLNPNEHAVDVVLRLWAHGSISGIVRDESGEPIPGVEVTAHRVHVIAGRLGIETGSRSTTDADGRFAIAEIFPASYVVSARFGPRPPAAGARVGEGGAVERTLDHPRIFYPDAFAPAGATILTLESGEARAGLELTRRAVPVVSVSGAVVGLPPDAGTVSVSLVRDSSPTGIQSDLDTVAGSANATGAFTFPRVPQGRYVVRFIQFPRPRAEPGTIGIVQTAGASGFGFSGGSMKHPQMPLAPVPAAPTLYVEYPLVVGDEPIAHLSVVALPAARITGTLRFDGAARKPTGGELLQIPVIVTTPAGRTLPSFPMGRVEANGTFATVGLPPGTYSLTFMPGIGVTRGGAPLWPESWRNQRMTIGGRPVVDGVIQLDTRDVHVTATMTDSAPAGIQGSVRDATGAPPPDASIFIVPADRRLWTMGVRGRQVRPNRRGSFQIDLPAGEYLVVASRTAPELWDEAGALEQLMKSADRVSLREGEKRSLELVVR